MRSTNQMKYKFFPNLKKALEFLGEEKKYDYEHHKFKRGELINRHYHPRANEFIIADQGKFTLIIGEEEFNFHVQGKVCVIKITNDVRHSLQVKSRISYFVFRDKRDKTIYC